MIGPAKSRLLLSLIFFFTDEKKNCDDDKKDGGSSFNHFFFLSLSLSFTLLTSSHIYPFHLLFLLCWVLLDLALSVGFGSIYLVRYYFIFALSKEHLQVQDFDGFSNIVLFPLGSGSLLVSEELLGRSSSAPMHHADSGHV